MKLSEKIGKVAPSVTLAITSKAKEMLSKGEDVIVLAAGEPDFDTPEIVKNAAIKAINDGYTKYTPAGGSKELKEAICCKLNKDNNLKYKPSEVVVSNGAKHSIYNVLQVICNPGDEVIVVSPYWLSYPEMVVLAGATPKIIKTEKANGFRVTVEQVKEVVNKNTRAVILNSPSNPAGVVYNETELSEIADFCVSNGIMIISDEIYEKIIFDGEKHSSIAGLSDEVKSFTVVVNGLSKSHSMTGWRVGYMAADESIAKMVTTLQSHSTSNPCSISQAAAVCALTTDLDKEILKNAEEFQKRRDFLVKSLSESKKLVPFNPAGAFYLFCDISACGIDSLSFAQNLLRDKKTAVIPGKPFGHDDFIRISFATDMETLKEGAERIKEWIGS
ncbi:MAG: pyridoxal phosphate-dependent aminotransferase [Candidatus Omnitrophota bacterium]|nr:pyridoxal phosphate-dependent aminotransferase [Candidatus Omnitrophota bacterium]MBU1894275.1 pyridoxal phosphate-dependent aminotransferase [Candidatus Omnitrophota bacterium]